MTKGVYIIKNQKTGYVYIGSSIIVETRIKDHFEELKKGTHGNYKLQKAYNRYKKHFTWEVLVKFDGYIDRDRLYQEEQYFLDSIEKQYNILKGAKDHLDKDRKKNNKKKKKGGWQRRLNL